MRISGWSSDVCSSDLLDLATPMKGPFAAIPVIAPDLAAAALQLARIAGIMPAFFVRTDAADSEVSITPAAISAHEAAARVTIAARDDLTVMVREGRKSVVRGKGVGVGVEFGGRRK